MQRARSTGVTAGDAGVAVFAPASVSNVGCGFDIFGFAVEGLGDTVVARHTARPGVTLAAIEGDGGRLPVDAERNTAGVAAARVLEAAGQGQRQGGVELRLSKGMPLASGLGSSAASAVAAAVAVDGLLGSGLSRETLLACAIEGERVACGAAHADNAAPSLYGGFVLVRGSKAVGGAPRVDRLPVPEGLACALLRPHVEVETRAARQALGDRVPLAAAVRQWGNVAALVAGLFRGDPELLASALEDAVAEPVRAALVPGFRAVQAAALETGALGASLSGSGPTIFALCRDLRAAREVAAAMAAALEEATGLAGDVRTTRVEAPGAHRVEEPPCAT